MRQSRRLRLAVVADAVADAAVGKEGARVRLRVRVGMVARILPRATRLLDPVTRAGQKEKGSGESSTKGEGDQDQKDNR